MPNSASNHTNKVANPPHRTRQRRLKWTLGSFLGAWFIAQLMGPRPNNNEGSLPDRHMSGDSTVPVEVANFLEASCANCHSDRTSWPWYAGIAPASWWIVGRVERARERFNMSDWGNYSAERKATVMSGVCAEMQSGRMPDRVYSFLHPEVQPEDAQVAAVCDWVANRRRLP